MRTSRVTSVTVAGTSQTLLGPSEKRVALAFQGGNAGRVTFSNDSPAVLDGGITLVQGASPFTMTYEVHGDCVKRSWFAIAAVAGTVIGVMEVLEG